jgi:hypothetical protein
LIHNQFQTSDLTKETKWSLATPILHSKTDLVLLRTNEISATMITCFLIPMKRYLNLLPIKLVTKTITANEGLFLLRIEMQFSEKVKNSVCDIFKNYEYKPIFCNLSSIMCLPDKVNWAYDLDFLNVFKTNVFNMVLKCHIDKK